MKLGKTLYVADRKSWRAWLAKHHKTEPEIWLIFYKKGSGKPGIPYNDTVEQALCYGWIDSIVTRIDKERHAQKFTPRKPTSKWSSLNINRMEKLIHEGKVTKAGLELYRKRNLEKPIAEKLKSGNIEMPSDLEDVLRRNKQAWKNWNNFARSYRKNYIGWIISAKKEETRKRRIKEAVSLIEKNTKTLMK